MTAAQVIEHDNKSGSQSLKSNPSKPLPRKRARTNKEFTRASKRGGKPSLRRILDMSPEIFNETLTNA
ncbi:hypothetical protein FRC09_013637 [Ceratobasidium sp. 395]|nr:hypothetical protein FRC09_013637 [Ceratobasidium sp. 395]